MRESKSEGSASDIKAIPVRPFMRRRTVICTLHNEAFYSWHLSGSVCQLTYKATIYFFPTFKWQYIFFFKSHDGIYSLLTLHDFNV